MEYHSKYSIIFVTFEHFYLLQTRTALVHDAVRMFSSALQDMHIAEQTVEPMSLKCALKGERWPQGMEILQIIDKV